MSTRVVVTLPDEVHASARRLADLMHREVAGVLTDALKVAIPSLRPAPDPGRPVDALSDAELLALSELQLPPEQDRRLTVLLDRQQAGSLTEIERPELAALMQAYQEGLLRKAQALEEAVRRRLREPLGP
jgi:hypothetical protein